jgi:hypothetical protein
VHRTAALGITAEMPTSHPADTRRAADPPAASTRAAEQVGGAGVYLTDEVFLYRIVRVVADAAGAMIDLEDCLMLDVVRVPLAEVRARRLRVIRAPGAA